MNTAQIKKVWEEALEKTSGARFYKCALQVNPHSYSAYRGQSTMNEGEYNNQIVQKCTEHKIEIIGLADHGSVQESEMLRRSLSSAGIVVFPGFEICSSEKVQMVCLFPPGTTEAKLNQTLGALQGDAVRDNEKTYPSSHTVLQIAEKVFQHNGVWYAAHMEEDNGLLKLHQDGGGLWHIWKEEKLVLAGQIKNTIDDLEHKYEQIILNKDPNYKRINFVSIINAKDVEKPESLDDLRASCFIKMTEPSIEALKQAFLDGESRIRLSIEEETRYHSKIRAVTFEGGFLDGIRIHFNDNLNAIIGGRGSGKSTILECIRYCLDIQPKSKEARKVHKSIVEQNLKNGRVSLLIYSHWQNHEYVISRVHGEPLKITDKEGNISHLSIDDLLPEIEILGQNEILTLAADRVSQINLLNRFLPEKPLDKDVVIRKLKENRQRLISALETKENTEAEVSELKKLQEQQQQFKKLGIQEKLFWAEKYEQEKNRIIKRVKEEVAEISQQFENFKEITNIDLTYLNDEAINDLPNQELFRDFRVKLEQYLQNMQAHLNAITKANEQLSNDFEDLEQGWNSQQNNFHEDIMKIISKLPDMAGKTGKQLGGEYLRIVKKISLIQASEKQLSRHENVVKRLQKEREKLLAELDDMVFNEFQNLEKAVKNLNKKYLNGRVRIKAEKGKNRKRLFDFFADIPGISDKRTEWVSKVNDMTVRSLALHVKEGKEKLLEMYREHGLTEGVAEILAGIDRNKKLELEEVVLENETQIELNVSKGSEERYQPLENLSTGQKCTAILHLLLLENKDPLIIDQPEDNLDNAFIADRIVKDLRMAKEKRQFIISTHNANIPVFGDAEWIGALDAKEDRAYLKDERVGSIDMESVRECVEEILEGGKAAFEIRRLKYGF